MEETIEKYCNDKHVKTIVKHDSNKIKKHDIKHYPNGNKMSEMLYDDKGRGQHKIDYYLNGNKMSEVLYEYDIDSTEKKTHSDSSTCEPADEYLSFGKMQREIEIHYSPDGRKVRENEYLYHNVFWEGNDSGVAYVIQSKETNYYPDKMIIETRQYDFDENPLTGVKYLCKANGKPKIKIEYDFFKKIERKSYCFGKREISATLLKWVALGAVLGTIGTILLSVRGCTSQKNKGPSPVLMENQLQR